MLYYHNVSVFFRYFHRVNRLIHKSVASWICWVQSLSRVTCSWTNLKRDEQLLRYTQYQLDEIHLTINQQSEKKLNSRFNNEFTYTDLQAPGECRRTERLILSDSNTDEDYSPIINDVHNLSRIDLWRSQYITGSL